MPSALLAGILHGDVSASLLDLDATVGLVGDGGWTLFFKKTRAGVHDESRASLLSITPANSVRTGDFKTLPLDAKKMATTKVPIYLKRGSRRGKKEKLRDILSSEMISPPLGDFRHTIHIGSRGESDMFGDISFLQGKFHLLPRSEDVAPEGNGHYVVPFEFSRTSTLSGYKPQPLDNPSPLLKNAISLPVIGGLQALSLPSPQAPPKPPRLHLDGQDCSAPRTEEPLPSLAKNGWASEPHAVSSNIAVPPLNGFTAGENKDGPFSPHAGSLLSLHVDLGPSILDDVLGVMEKHQTERLDLRDPARLQILT